MKKVSRRALAALVLAAVLLGGGALFCVNYALQARQWVTFPGSPHVYRDGVLQSGTVIDAAGEPLLQLTGERVYSQDPAVRKAFLHLLGDRSGNISAPILRKYASQLVGYNPVTGVFSTDSAPVEMEMTLYSSVQKAAFEALGNRKGTIAVYNYVNGEILCAVSAPAYDPDNMPDISADASGKYDGIYVNRFTGSVYVPGSIFKLVTTACALDTFGESVLERTFLCEGKMAVGDDVVTCNGYHGEVGLKEALAKSCNCAFGQLSMELGADTLQNYVNRMGVTESFAVDGIQTAAGRFDVMSAADVELAWSGIGQYTVMVNPYSFLRFVGAIAGDGTAAEPHFVSEVGSYKAKEKHFEVEFSENTAQLLKEFMANNVQTVYGAGNFPDVAVCAKSGTAEVGEGQRPHATFAGFVDDLRYPLAFVVVVENGGSGSETCAALTGKVLSACISAMENAK